MLGGSRFDSDAVRDAAREHWPAILSQVAGIPHAHLDGRHHACPACGGKDRFRCINREAGAVLCNQCFRTNNGDGFAAVMHFCKVNFPEAVCLVAEYLGVSPVRPTHPANEDWIGRMSTVKRCPRESLVAYGATVQLGHKAVSFPVYDPNGQRCSTFRVFPSAKPGTPELKGKLAYRRPSGVFLPHDNERNPILPSRGIVSLIVEGCKDAAALHGLGYHAVGINGDELPQKFVCMFRGVDVVVIPDRTLDAEEKAQRSASRLFGHAASVKVASLPLPLDGSQGDDTRDALKQPDGESLLREAIENALNWKPTANSFTETPLQGEYVPFCVEMLPDPLRCFVTSGSRALGCDTAYLVLPMLSVLAAAIGNSRRIQIKRSWCEPCIIWTVVIGESGTMKSPAFDLAVDPLRSRQAVEYHEYEEQFRRYEQELQIYDADYTCWKKTGSKNDQPPPEKPVPPVWQQYIAEDTTIEALAELLSNQPRGLLLARDELSGWLASFDAYKAAKGADVAYWLSTHRGGELLVNRKGGKKLTRVASASVSICGGIQPARLASSLGREHFENGLAARLLLAMPPRTPKLWTDDDLTEADHARIECLLSRLLSLEMLENELGERQPVDLPLSEAAKRSWIDFYIAHNQEQCQLSGELAAAWSKLEGYAARLALLCQLIRNPESEEVDLQSIETGITLARWFADEAARVYRCLGAGGDTSAAKESRELNRVADWILGRGGEVSARDLQRSQNRYRTADEAEAVLDRMAKAGKGRWVVRETRGRPARVFCMLDNTDTDTSSENT